jgi:hypothetical protein
LPRQSTGTRCVGVGAATETEAARRPTFRAGGPGPQAAECGIVLQDADGAGACGATRACLAFRVGQSPGTLADRRMDAEWHVFLECGNCAEAAYGRLVVARLLGWRECPSRLSPLSCR